MPEEMDSADDAPSSVAAACVAVWALVRHSTGRAEQRLRLLARPWLA
jgi:hypothetical protein